MRTEVTYSNHLTGHISDIFQHSWDLQLILLGYAGNTKILIGPSSVGTSMDVLQSSQEERNRDDVTDLLHGWWAVHHCSQNKVFDPEDEDPSVPATTRINLFFV